MMTAPTLDQLEAALEVADALGDPAHAAKVADAITAHNTQEGLIDDLVSIYDDAMTKQHFRASILAVYEKGRSDAEEATKRLTDEQEKALRVCLNALNDPSTFEFSDFRGIESEYWVLRKLVPGRLNVQ